MYLVTVVGLSVCIIPILVGFVSTFSFSSGTGSPDIAVVVKVVVDSASIFIIPVDLHGS